MRKSMKEKLIKGSKGAISIFLVLILVPMMTVSCLFVDLSRVQLAKAMVDSAADLTMNAALTQYDSLLQEYYGIFATSQNIDQFLDTLDEYFEKCIKSAGVSEKDAQLLSSKMIGSLKSNKGENITDLINIVFDSSNFNIQRAAGASLCNPAFLKAQIVNFMKYRAPINSGLSLISSLKSFKNLSKETELIEKRQAYYEAEKEVNTTCQETWAKIDEYNQLDCCKSESYFNTMKKELSANSDKSISFAKRYLDIVKTAYKDIYISNNKNTGDKLDYTCNAHKMNLYISSFSSGQSGQSITWYYFNNNNIYTNKTLNRTGSKRYQVAKSNGRLNATVPDDTDFKSAVSTAYTALLDLINKSNELPKPDSGVSDIRYVYHYVTKGSQYDTAAKNFADAMQKVEYCYRWIPVAELADDCESTKINGVEGAVLDFTLADLDERYTVKGKTLTLASWYNYLYSNLAGSNGYFKKYYDYSTGLASKAKTAKSTYDTSLGSINNRLSTISSTMKNYKDQMNKASGLLDDISKKLNKIYEAVNDEGGSLISAKNSWSTSVNSVSGESTIASQDKAEIANIAKQFKPDEIKALKTRIDNIKTNIDNVKNELDNYKFGSKKISDIKSYGDLRGPLHTAATNGGKVYNPQTGNGDKPYVNNTLELHAEAIFKSDKGYKNGDSKLLDWIDQQDCCPYLKKHILNFYTYLYKNFHKTGDISQIQKVDNNGVREKNEDYSENAENAEKDISSKGSEKTNAVDTSTAASGNNINDKADLPSSSGPEVVGEGSGGTVKASETGDTLISADSNNAATKAKNTTSSIFSGIGNIVSNLKDIGTDVRDAMFMTEYVIDMLSYDTIEYSGNSASKPAEGSKVENLRSLTLNGINTTNNVAYRSEAEYVLYGGSNSGNIAKAYATIYAIRLAFNLIFAFSDAELRNTALAIATPLSAATAGIVPVPLIQAGILAACAAAESGVDIYNLKNGKDVPLYKNDQTWACKLSSAVGNVVKGVAGDIIKEVGNELIDKSANKIYEWLDKSDDELKEIGAEGLNKLEVQMESAYDTLFDEQISVVMNEMTSLITTKIQDVSGDGTVMNKEDMIKYIQNNLKTWLNGEGSSGLMKDVRSTVVDLIISNSETYIRPIVEKIYSASSTESLDSLATAFSTKVKDETKNIKMKITEKYQSVVDSATKSAKNAVNDGADKLKSTLNNTLDSFSGTSGSDGINATTGNNSSLFSFSYRDYIRLFLILKFLTDETTALMRLADVIQVNMGVVENDEFRMKNAACYVSIDCTVSVKPLFLAVPLIANTSGVSADGQSSKHKFFYQYHYNQMKGY